MAKFGYVGNQPDASSVIVARQIYNATTAVGVVTFTSQYTPGYLDVYLNGVRLVDGLDFSASDGSTIILTTAATSGDVIEAVAYKALNISTSQIGINSGGTLIKDNVTTLNFIGLGNTFHVSGNTVDIAIGGLGTANISASTLVVAGISTLGNITAGVVTANQFSGNISGVAATFSGNVTVDGTLTCDDVTNIDSIGLITARSGIQFGLSGVGGTITATGDAEFIGVVTATSFSGSGADLTNLNIPSSFTELDATLFG